MKDETCGKKFEDFTCGEDNQENPGNPIICPECSKKNHSLNGERSVTEATHSDMPSVENTNEVIAEGTEIYDEKGFIK